MGLNRTQIHFEDGIPLMEEIRNQFLIQTGLNLWIIADLNLIQLPESYSEIITNLSMDLEKYEVFKKKGFKGSWQEHHKERGSINHLDLLQFYNSRFYGVEFRTKGNSIILEYPSRCYYFPTSIVMSLLSLNGQILGFNEEIDKSWKIPKAWKRLKHWDNYKWYNRPRK